MGRMLGDRFMHGEEYDLDQMRAAGHTNIFIGRDSELCQIVAGKDFPGDRKTAEESGLKTVSRRHAKIIYDSSKDEYLIKNAGSTNSIKIKRHDEECRTLPPQASYRLRDGDTIILGQNYEFFFYDADAILGSMQVEVH